MVIACPAAGWQHVAALADSCPAARLEIADVIICARRLSVSEAAAWVDATLGRYPGCAVAAASTVGMECLVGTRGGSPIRLVPRACADIDEPGLLASLCGALAHWWLAGGRPLTELELATVRVTATGAPLCWRRPAHEDVGSCSLGVAGGPVSEPGRSSRCRICPASGAPTST